MNEMQSERDDSDLRKYRTEIPNMADDDLDPFQYRLYAHYKRVCGATGGECYEGVRTTAERTKMSNEKVISTRQWLANNGWITIDQRAKGTFSITIVDRWGENFVRYSERSGFKTVRNSEQSTRTPLEIPNSTVRNSEQSPLEISNQRSNHIKKEQNKKRNTATQSAHKAQRKNSVDETSNTTKVILDAYIEVRGKNGINYGKEGKAAKRIADEGGTPELVKGCYAWLKQDKFWEFKTLGLSRIHEQLPDYQRYLERTAATAKTKIVNGRETLPDGFKVVPMYGPESET